MKVGNHASPITDKCSECGEHWEHATFLSETFNYSGGTMVFECQCGNTKVRNFIPTDVMSEEDLFRSVMKQEGVDSDIIETAITRYKSHESKRSHK